MTGALTLIHGNATSLPLADRTVHLIVTSPPYFALRSYRDGDAHYDGQLGSEPTPHHFLANLWAVLDECWRVLRDDGSCWVNLGDKFAGSGGHNNAALSGPSAKSTLSGSTASAVGCGTGEATRRQAPDRYNQNTGGLRSKSRMLLPHRFALGLIDPDYRHFEEARAGINTNQDHPQWICRMDAVWSKANGLPESVTDRVRASHEYWLHFTKSERYYSALDEIREDYDPKSLERYKSTPLQELPAERRTGKGDGYVDGNRDANPLGKAPGSVWTVPTEPLSIPADLPQHFAAFPSWFPRRLILGWSPSGVCVACGEGRRPVCEREFKALRPPQSNARRRHSSDDDGLRGADNHYGGPVKIPGEQQATITGTVCACPTPTAPTTPAVILDPFSGTGTTPVVAAALGRHGIGVDLSWDYHRIAQWRHADGGLRAKALGVDRPEKQLAGQLDLFEGM